MHPPVLSLNGVPNTENSEGCQSMKKLLLATVLL